MWATTGQTAVLTGKCPIVPASTIMELLDQEIRAGCAELTSRDRSRTSPAPRRELRNMLVPGAALLLPGVANALAARVVADQGFTAAYVTGAGIANTFFGVPDI